MFLPFLPHLLALAGVAAVLGLGTPAGPPLSLPVALAVYLALPLLGGALGHVPERWAGSHRMNTLSRRRVGVLLLWLWVLTLLGLPQALARILAPLGAGQELAMLVLVLNFWLADALALYPYNPLRRADLDVQRRRLVNTLRLPLPVLALIVVGLAMPALLGTGPLLRWSEEPGLFWVQPLIVLGVMLVVAAVAIPVLIRVCWGLRPLESARAEHIVRDELAANGVTVARVLTWPEELMGVSTAGVIGLVPRFRYLLMSNRLSRALTEDELRSVTAHESAHLRHRHLWFLLIAIFSFVLVMQALVTLLFWLGLVTDVGLPMWGYIALELVALLLFLRVGVGFLSRQFERQADGQALRRQGLAPFHNAIIKVGLLNGIPPQQNNWHHYGIAQRVAFLERCQQSPDVLVRHDRKVRRVQIALAVLLLLGLGAQGAVSSPQTVGYFTHGYLVRQAEAIEQPTPSDLPLLRFLAYRALEGGSPVEAARWFRKVLQAAPADAASRNNLAWILVTQEGADAAQLREGLTLARQAAEQSDSAFIWDTVAEAHARLQQHERAARAAEHALARARDGDGLGDASLDYYRQRAHRFRQQAGPA